jgi:hypothetical protein
MPWTTIWVSQRIGAPARSADDGLDLRRVRVDQGSDVRVSAHAGREQHL